MKRRKFLAAVSRFPFLGWLKRKDEDHYDGEPFDPFDYEDKQIVVDGQSRTITGYDPGTKTITSRDWQNPPTNKIT